MTMTNLGSAKSFGYQKAVRITSAQTLTQGDNGKTIFLDAAGGAYTVTLPSVRAGLHFRFFVQEKTPSGAITIAAGSAIIFGWMGEAEVTTNDDAPGSSDATGISNIIFGTGCSRGTFVEMHCDGTSWYIMGMSEIDGDITTS